MIPKAIRLVRNCPKLMGRVDRISILNRVGLSKLLSWFQWLSTMTLVVGGTARERRVRSDRASAAARRRAPHLAAAADVNGRAVQVAPIKPTLKAPGTERLKLNHEELL